MFKPRRSSPARSWLLMAAIAPVLGTLTVVRAEDSSPAPILQYFESTYGTLESRMSDVFAAGYGSVYTPPPGRADSGGQSVGYDQYNRFDLGSAGNPTLYGTETGLKAAVNAAHTAGLDYGIDFVMNHAGYSGTGNAAQNQAFQQAGGYPGLVTVLQTSDPNAPGYNTLGYNSVDGDFHGAYASGDDAGRLAGLIDIDHTTNWQLIRNPTTAGDPRNIPAGTVTNIPDPNNARFYPDTSGAAGVKYLYDPTTGEQNIAVYNFNTANPMAGTAVPENVTGYLMRNAQWLVQTVGVDMFRLDATKNMDPFVLNYFDRAVYRLSNRTLLDGSQKQIFAFGEAYSSDTAYLQTLIRKDINPNDPGRIGGNRDTLDFPLFFALRSNLTSNGYNNDWRNVVGASLDYADDGLMNGSIGVKFAASADDYGADLSNVSYAYTLMTPGNSIVYDNAKQFGNGRDFPKSGRADALGGAYGDQITKLVNIRDVYAQGNFTPRYLSKESYAFERNRQSLTLLSNRSDNYYDNEKIDVNFAYGTYLVELTGNAAKYGAPQVLQVTNDYYNGPSYVNAQFLPNNGGDHGYLVYGLQAPQGSVTLGNISKVIAGGTPTLSGTADQQSYQNATTRLADLNVVTGNSISVNLNTIAVNLLGSIRDKNADGDNALLKLDGGIDLNHNGHVDYVTPGGTAYGFEEFTGTHNPGYFTTSGNGDYAQTIDTTGLSEGYHYLTVRAFRHRDDGGPAVYQDFKETLYVDRLKPLSSVDSFHAFGTNAGDNDLWLKSDDQTANSVHVFLNLPANLTDAQILTMAQNGQGNTDQIDRDIFKTGFFGVPNGNNTVTIVTYEITGNSNVQRYTGINPTNHLGAGIGDLNHDGAVGTDDLSGTSYGFEHFLYAKNTEFNPSADVNGDGLIDNRDLFALDTTLAGASAAVKSTLRQVELTRGNINGQYGTDAYDIDALYRKNGETGNIWFDDLNVDGKVDKADVDTLVRQIFKTEYGDVNLDGRVDIADMRLLAAHYHQTNQGWAMGDLTGDTNVNELDLSLMGQYWNFGVPADQQISFAQAESIVGVPEPIQLGTFGMAALLVMRRKNRRAVARS
ncbi:MAG: dockerin type I domain-containing protein [Tepidisphaeraceae bacterium]